MKKRVTAREDESERIANAAMLLLCKDKEVNRDVELIK